ncbi:unnamed protein product, partial [Prorocentrum cordatum]
SASPEASGSRISSLEAVRRRELALYMPVTPLVRPPPPTTERASLSQSPRSSAEPLASWQWPRPPASPSEPAAAAAQQTAAAAAAPSTARTRGGRSPEGRAEPISAAAAPFAPALAGARSGSWRGPRLQAELAHDGGLRLRSFQVALARDSPSAIFGLSVTDTAGAELEVSFVDPSGALARWNRDNPSKALAIGDRIVAVDHIARDPARMRRELSEAAAVVLYCMGSSASDRFYF